MTFNFSHVKKERATFDDFRILPFSFSGGRMAEHCNGKMETAGKRKIKVPQSGLVLE